jgi:putative hydrolase of the HAD superfamily
MTVLFDLGNVLVAFHPERFFPTLGIDNGEGQVKYRPGLIELVRRYEHGLMTTKEFLPKLEALFEKRAPQKKVLEAFLSVMGEPVEGMEDLVRRVSSRHRVGLVSNTNEIHFNHVSGYVKALSMIDQRFLSYELKTMKPESQYYRSVLSRLSGAGNDVIFVDDIAENVAGASEAGMRGILFRSSAQLARELKSLRAM